MDDDADEWIMMMIAMNAMDDECDGLFSCDDDDGDESDDGDCILCCSFVLMHSVLTIVKLCLTSMYL